MRGALVLLLVAGCDRVLGLDRVPAIPDAVPDGPDAALPDAPGIGTCLADMFSGTSLDLATWRPFWTNTSQPVPMLTVTGGVLQVLLYTGTPSTTMAYNGVDSVVSYPFAKGWVEVQLVEVPAVTEPNAEMQLYLELDANNSYLVAILGQFLVLTVHATGQATTTMQVNFDRATEHYVRIRDGGDGNAYIDTANIPGAWNQRIVHPATVSFDMLSIGLDAGTDAPGTGTMQKAQFDNVVVRSPACAP